MIPLSDFRKRFGCRLSIATILGLVFTAIPLAFSQTETLLYNFCTQDGCSDGSDPIRVIPVLDKKGNIYGMTEAGGAYSSSCSDSGCGTVFKLSPTGEETILHSFNENGTDGAYPGAGLLGDNEGNLYGTTWGGGAYTSSCEGFGCGTVFKLTSSGTETILHSFDEDGTDGYWPVASLILDKEGNLYGTASGGGAYGYGAVFKVTPTGTETVLYSFGQTETDGRNPDGALAMDGKGNLFGTTESGGAYSSSCDSYGCGTVFEITPSGREIILHSFDENGTDGIQPAAGLVITGGNLYGTTSGGGAYGWGTVFKVTSSRTETVLHSFNQNGSDGVYPYASLVMDNKGNLYGTTLDGGSYGWGTVFELTPSGTETILHSFENSASDGFAPNAGVALDEDGNLYGATQIGGAYSKGTVYKITP